VRRQQCLLPPDKETGMGGRSLGPCKLCFVNTATSSKFIFHSTSSVPTGGHGHNLQLWCPQLVEDTEILKGVARRVRAAAPGVSSAWTPARVVFLWEIEWRRDVGKMWTSGRDEMDEGACITSGTPHYSWTANLRRAEPKLRGTCNNFAAI